METAVRRPKKYKTSRVAPIRRRELIQAAIRDISAHGYDQVTVASICEEAGFSRGLIGHYFSSKDDLLLEAVKTVGEELHEAFRDALALAGQDPQVRLHALVAASFAPPAFTPEKVSVWVALIGAARWSPRLAEIYRQLWVEYRVGVSRLVARAAPAAPDPDRIALTFSQMVEGFWVACAADPKSVTPKKAEQCCHAYLDLLLGAPPEPPRPRKAG